MRLKTLCTLIPLGIAMLALAACGGGGSSSGTVVSGVAQAGIIAGGTVKVYGVNADGTLTATPLATAATGSDGKYRADIGGYRGAIVVKVFGKFVDEATGATVDIPEINALQAGAPASTVTAGSVSLPVTPLTDIAVRKAQALGKLADTIAAANTAVTQVFGVDITSQPVAPTALATATDEQKKYVTLLATLSQMVATSAANPAAPTASELQNAATKISAAISTGGATAALSAPEVALALQKAATAVTTNDKTKSIVTAAGAAAQTVIQALSTIGNQNGSKIVSYRLRTVGAFTGSLYGVQLQIAVPGGVTLRADSSTGETAAGVVAASGVAPGSSLVTAKSASGTLSIALMSATGMPGGEFVTIYGDIPASATAPLASAFGAVTGVKAVDGQGTQVNGITVEVF